jgi:hypothetical protein
MPAPPWPLRTPCGNPLTSSVDTEIQQYRITQKTVKEKYKSACKLSKKNIYLKMKTTHQRFEKMRQMEAPHHRSRRQRQHYSRQRLLARANVVDWQPQLCMFNQLHIVQARMGEMMYKMIDEACVLVLFCIPEADVNQLSGFSLAPCSAKCRCLSEPTCGLWRPSKRRRWQKTPPRGCYQQKEPASDHSHAGNIISRERIEKQKPTRKTAGGQQSNDNTNYSQQNSQI